MISSTRAWLTRLDLPEPETPVTAVNTPNGNATSTPRKLLPRDALELEPILAASRGRVMNALRADRDSVRSRESLERREALEGTAVQHAPAVLAGPGSHVHDPVGAAHHLEIVLDHEQ